MRLKKIIFNEKDNIKIHVFALDDEKFVISQKEYSEQLEKYAASVLDQVNIKQIFNIEFNIF